MSKLHDDVKSCIMSKCPILGENHANALAWEIAHEVDDRVTQEIADSCEQLEIQVADLKRRLDKVTEERDKLADLAPATKWFDNNVF